MNVKTNGGRTVEDLVLEVIEAAPYGGIVSVKSTIAAVREDGPHWEVTNCDLIEFIVEAAPAFGRAVAFDQRE
ncbi:conserved hypothetical protein [Mesorhizobium prunaredense]|uniref:Uncharacterized protein n=1 Tax=Mesorhizobium prunaredense TaxID=1631249 RepID=A0A1R3V8L5_9HYPH|nr:hypothetical protein [Mesorhizobium prunaredense]SIT56242.1 conserved hypothetical protein [Mesorhizobium prunaredense]